MISKKYDKGYNPEIDEMDQYSLWDFLSPFIHHQADKNDSFDYTDDGVNAMHALIRFYGLSEVSDCAPKDWAWQLVGIIGIGFSGVTRPGVTKALIEEGWTKNVDRRKQKVSTERP